MDLRALTVFLCFCSSEAAEVRLKGGLSGCAGMLEVKGDSDWGPVQAQNTDWDLAVAASVCRKLDCGSMVSLRRTRLPLHELNPYFDMANHFFGAEVVSLPSSFRMEVTCSDSVRLVNGTHPCSGRLQVKWNQVWSSVCADGFDLQDAEVVCRELGCGSPAGFEEELHGEAPVFTTEFQCGGHESALMRCGSSSRDTCSPGTAMRLTCSAPDYLRLVGSNSTCAGELQMNIQGQWRPVADWDSNWNQSSAAVVCSRLGCGSAVASSVEDTEIDRPAWWIRSSCFPSAADLQSCVVLSSVVESILSLQVICSDLLAQPSISISSSHEEVQLQDFRVPLGSNFSITCSIRPQYPGGSFQLVFASSSTRQIRTLPAVSHSATFPFSAAGRLHRGTYACVYHLNAFSYNFSSASRPIHLIASAPLMDLLLRLVVLLLGMVVLVAVLCYGSETPPADTRRRNKRRNVLAGLQ